MQALTLNCPAFTYTPISPCKNAVELPAEAIGASVCLGPALYALITVQPGDTERGARRVAKGLRRIARNTNRSRIAVNGYAHLGPHLASPGASVEILDYLVAQLRETGEFEVIHMPFGWRKRWEGMEVLDGEWDQRSIYVTPDGPVR